jgi:hypothetical protein
MRVAALGVLGVMTWSAFATAGIPAARPGDDARDWYEADDNDDAIGQELWVFDDILLIPTDTGAVPSRVVVRIEAELLGFIIEEQSHRSSQRSWRTRKSYATTGAEAVVVAGRIVHSWLSRGYALCRR